MVFRLIHALVTFLVITGIGSLADAQFCQDWSTTRIPFSQYTEYRGDLCHLSENYAFVAEENLLILAFADGNIGPLLSSVPLPGTATGLAVDPPLVFVACEQSIVVAVDISDPSHPTIAASQEFENHVSAVAAFSGDLLVAEEVTRYRQGCIARTRLDGTGGFTVVALDSLEWVCEDFAIAGDEIICAGSNTIASFRYASPTSLEQVSQLGVCGGWNHRIAVQGREVFHSVQFQSYGEYFFTVSTQLSRYELGAGGILQGPLSSRAIPPVYDLTVRGSYVITSSNGYLKFFDKSDFNLRTLLARGGPSLSMYDNILLTSNNREGSFLVSTESTSPVLPILRMEDTIDFYDPMHFVSYVGLKCPPYLMVIRRSDYHDEYHAGYTSRSDEYTIYDVADPAAPIAIYSGASSSNCHNNNDGCLIQGLHEIDLPGGNSEHVLHRWTRGSTYYGTRRTILTTIDRRSGDAVNSMRPIDPYLIAGDVVWECGPDSLRRTKILCSTADAPPPSVYDVAIGGKLLACDGDLVIDSTELGMLVYEPIAADSLMFHGRFTGAPPVEQYELMHWVGKYLVYVFKNSLHVVDFNDPSDPRATSVVELAGMARQLFSNDNHFIISSRSDEWLCQVFDVDNAGNLIERTSPFPVYAGGGVATENVIYLRTGGIVHEYDISGGGTPTLIGQVIAGPGNLFVMDEYLISGPLVYNRDCQDSRPPLEVTIDIKPHDETNAVNCRNRRGVIPVAVLSTPEFGALTIDHTTVRFGSGLAAETHRNGRGVTRHEVDIDRDGDIDLMFHFRIEEAGISCDDAKVTLTGSTLDGRLIVGSDLIRSVGNFADKIVEPQKPRLIPNPFNPELAISFTLAEPAQVRIEVYDIRGRFVTSLANRAFEPGLHSARWTGRDSHARDVPSGEYLFRVTIEGRVETYKATLLK